MLHDAGPLGTAAAPRSRLLAAAALILLVVAVVLLCVGVVRGFPGVLGPAICGVIAVLLAWRALMSTGGHRLVLAVAAAAVGASAAVWVIWVSSQYPVLLAAAAAGLAGGPLAGASLSLPSALQHRPVRPARHPVLIVNPRSGGGAVQRSDLVGLARERGIEVVELGEGDDLGDQARTAVQQGADCLGMAGGDGSMAVVASVAMDADVAFVCVPAGTRNHFALDLGLDRRDPAAALDAFAAAGESWIDVGVVNGRRFLNNVSMGAYGEVVASEEYRNNKLGVALDIMPSLDRGRD